MRRYRTSLILGVLVVASLAYIYFLERKTPSTAELGERRDNVFARLDEDSISRIVLRRERDELVLAKHGDDWRIEKPVEADADGAAVDSLVSTLRFLTKQRTVRGDDVREREEFGLSDPRIRGEIVQSGETTRFAVGGLDASGRSVYVTVDDVPEVFVVEKEFHESLAKGVAEFREKRLAKLRMADVTRLRVEGGEAVLEVARDGAGFRMDRPTKVRASKTKVDDLLRNAENLRAERFLADGVTDLAAHGLEPAWRTLKLTLEDDERIELRVGGACEGHEGERRVTRVGSGTVACAKGDLFTALEDAPSAFRERRLVTVRAGDLVRVSVAGGGKRLELARRGERWLVIRPEEGPADKDAVERMMEDLGRSQATEFVPAEDLATKGLAPARFMAILELAQGDEDLRLAIGRKEGDSVWVRRGEEPTLLKVPASVVDVVAPSSLRFRPKQILNDDTLDARTLRIEGGPGTESQELEKVDGAWRVVAPVSARADSLAARDLVRRLAELTVERFDAERAEPRHGLETPRLVVHARFEREGGADAGSEEPEDADAGDLPPRPTERVREYTLTVGASTADGYYARLSGRDVVFVVPNAFFDDVSRPLVDRNLFQLDEGSTMRFSLERPGKARLSLVKDGEAWRREGGGSVDRSKVRELFDALSGARATRVVAYGTPSPAQGLAAPRARLVVTRDSPPEGEAAEIAILVGARVGEGADEGAYARREDVDAVFVLPKDVANPILDLDL